jgi:hypothetical protein
MEGEIQPAMQIIGHGGGRVKEACESGGNVGRLFGW